MVLAGRNLELQQSHPFEDLRISFAVLGRSENCLSHRLNCPELTGCGSVKIARLIAMVISSITSGGNDAFEQIFHGLESCRSLSLEVSNS